MKNKPFETWEEVRRELNFTLEEEAEIQLEMERIKSTIKNNQN